MREQSVLGWADEPAPKPADERRVRVLRFPEGGRWVVVLLGDPADRYVHYDNFLRKSVPCHELRHRIPEHSASACPVCAERGSASRRLEGYAPAMLRNESKRVWEQCVAVFTKGGLDQLADCAPAPYRGRVFDLKKTSKGTSTPMTVKELAPLHPDEFPAGLPATFDVRAVMLQVWYPDRVPTEAVRFIEPIPLRRVDRRSAAPTEREVLDVPAELVAELRQRGLNGLASKLTATTPAAPVSPPAPTPPAPEPRLAPPARRPAAARRASPGDSPESPPPSDTPVSLPTAVTPLDAPEVGPALDGLDAVISMQDILTRGAGSIICRDQGKRIPSTHPASRNGHHHANGKGGDQ